MRSRVDAERCSVPAVSGFVVSLAGAGFAAAGLWGRREARRALARERIIHPEDSRPVRSAAGARSLAEFIRRSTIESTAGRTFAEVEPYVDANGEPTSESARAGKDERTGQLLESPDHDLWIQSTTLQTALMQAYLAFRLSDAMVGLGAVLVVSGAGILAAGRRG